MRSFYPEDDDDFDEFEYIHQECVIFTGPHEKIEELAPAVPTWIFRPGGKNEDDKISVWFIGTQKRFFPFPNRKGLKRAHSLLKRWTAEKGHIRVKNMEELTKDRLSFWRSWKGALRQLKAAAAGDSDFEEVATHLEKSVHFGTWCYYEPGTQVINWILE